MTGGDGIIDDVEGLTHLKYDDSRTRCGLWFTMYPKDLHKLTHVWGIAPTCIVCACWQPEPRDKPLWRTWG